jgi:SAM-dependent methyltransferase
MGRLHNHFVHEPRVRALSLAIAPLLKGLSSVADVGCGDAQLVGLLAGLCPETQFEGFEVHRRPGPGPAGVPIHEFNGEHLPLPDGAVDGVLVIDVLHHTQDPARFLRELCRVARKAVVIKDHLLDHPAAHTILSAMDWVSNRPYSVALPNNYWPRERWRQAWKDLGLEVAAYRTDLGLYPRPFRPIFENGLHFLARLEKHGWDRRPLGTRVPSF